MKNLVFLLVFFSFNTSAQKYDYVWTFGYGKIFPNGGTNINFNFDPCQTEYIKRDINFSFDCASICDRNGKFLFSTNGCKIFNANNKLTKNGDGLNPGLTSTNYCGDGNLIPQGSLFLPHPSDSSLFYLFHLRPEFVTKDQIGGIADKVYYTLIDKSKENGLGEVLTKNNIIYEDTMAFGKLTAVRHGNGRDWWIVVPRMFKNRYIKLLFTDQGISGPFFQDIGLPNDDDNGTGQAVFSPDGSKYIHFDRYNDLSIFDFNRCDGALSNFIRITLPTYRDSILVNSTFYAKYSVGGVAVSQNSRFLYVTTQSDVFQYDLLSSDIKESVMIVAKTDSFLFNKRTIPFFLPQLAPDNKIYICCQGSAPFLHVINNPNSRGLGCNVTQHSFVLPTYNAFSIPKYPNYRLGALKGSPCDTLHSIAVREKANSLQATLFPNPTSDQVTIKWQNDDGVACEVDIIDAVGRIIQRQESHASSLIFDTSSWANGLYYVQIVEEKGRKKAFLKIAKSN
ncbi:MAG: T9SS type A sorting domain-containing protein [Saprospiraceae bacterium]